MSSSAHLGASGLGFPITIARNCAQLFSNCAQLWGVYRAHNCAQVKSTCVGNPKFKTRVFSFHVYWKPQTNIINVFWTLYEDIFYWKKFLSMQPEILFDLKFLSTGCVPRNITAGE